MKMRLPIIFQTETVECGLAALAMVLQYFGRHISLVELRRQHPLSLSGMSLTALISIAKQHGLVMRVIRAEPAEMNNLRLPAILHWNLNHFVVLRQLKRGQYIIHDPAIGNVSITSSMFADSFTGIALECFPASDFTKTSATKSQSLLSIIRTMPGIGSLWSKIMIYTLVYQIFLLFVPRYLKIAIDQIVPAQNVYLLLRVTFGYVGLRILIAAAKLLKTFCILKLDTDINLMLATNMFQRIMRLPLSWFEKRQLGDVIYRFNSIEQLRQIISNGLIDGIWSGLLAMISLVMLAVMSPSLCMLTLLFSTIFVAAKLRINYSQRIRAAEMMAAKSHEQSCLIENIRAIQPIKIFAREADRVSVWLNRYVSFLKTAYRFNFLRILSDNLKEFILGVELIALICFFSIALMQQHVSIGVIYVYLFYRQQFTDSLFIFMDKINDFKLLSMYGERLNDIMHHPVEIHSSSQLNIPVSYSLRANDLAFRYSPWEPYIFSGLNFAIREGECVAFVGPSGTGKTTLLKVLMGLLPPSGGQLLLGGVRLDHAAGYRQCIASVMQDDCLLSGTIGQNISFFSTGTHDESVYHYAHLAGIYDEIMRMPMKFDTLVGDMGTVLSGGQKQRILLARALYAQPKILFLDEATSHLDVAKEREVNRAIKSLGITRIMIAHRPDTINMADRVIEMELVMKPGN